MLKAPAEELNSLKAYRMHTHRTVQQHMGNILLVYSRIPILRRGHFNCL